MSIGVAGLDGGEQAGNDHNVGVYGSTPHGTAVLALANASGPETSTFGTEPIGMLAVAESDTTGRSAAIAAISSGLPF